MWDLAILDAHDPHQWPLEALGGMHGAQRDRGQSCGLAAAAVLAQADRAQQAAHRASRAALVRVGRSCC